ncbi:hypothetical protein R80B4_01903 [Fibrobacteres bacterium R8-0-B4]
MNNVFAAAVLLACLLRAICVGESGRDRDDPCDYSRLNERNYNGWGMSPTDLAEHSFDSYLQSERSKSKNEISRSLGYDYSSIWLTENNPKSEYTAKDRPQDGAIGLNYQRIEMYIGKAAKSPYNPDTYLVTGKSKVNKNICDFSGEIRLTNLFYGECPDGIDSDDRQKNVKCAVLFAEYVLYEDSAQNHTGVFKGKTVCNVRVDKTKMILNESRYSADDYTNRRFAGSWTDYKTQKPKHCEWGDAYVPEAVSYGDGEKMVCPKYLKYGWQDDAESVWNEKEKRYEKKNKWWLKK